MNIQQDFRKFALDRKNSSSNIDSFIKHTENALTPMIMEESNKHFGIYDVYSKLLCDRILFFGEEFNPSTCNVAIAQLLYLNSISDEDINIYCNSCGGSVIDGLALIDTINFINCDVSTTCIGMAASMGAVLLSCGKQGKRYVLPHSRVMIHQPMSRMGGQYADMEIELEQTKRCKDDLYAILSKNMNKPIEEIEKLCDRNSWFIGQEAVGIHLADSVITNIV